MDTHETVVLHDQLDQDISRLVGDILSDEGDWVECGSDESTFCHPTSYDDNLETQAQFENALTEIMGTRLVA